MIDVIIDIFPKKEVLNPETEAVKKPYQIWVIKILTN